jgi:transcriptional regulator with XRE-family HTH domain
MSTETQIVENIRYLIPKRGFTQRGLAIAARIPESSMSKILAGKRHVKAAELGAIAKALDVSADVLLWSDFESKL